MLKLENKEQLKKIKIGDYVRYTEGPRFGIITREMRTKPLSVEGIVDSELFEKYVEICFIKDDLPTTYWCDLEHGLIEIL